MNLEINNGSLNSNLRGFSVSNLILGCILSIEILFHAMIFIRTHDESKNVAHTKATQTTLIGPHPIYLAI